MKLPAIKPIRKFTSIVFYALHLPILLLIIGVFALSTFISSKFTQNKISQSTSSDGNVLSSGSGEDGDDDGDDNDEDEDESDDDNDEDSEDDDDDEDEDESEDEFEDDDDSSGESLENEENDDSNETKSEVRIENADGTYSIIKTEEEDGEIKREIRTYDPNGNKIRVEKYESEDGEEKSRVSVYDVSGNKISDIRLETEDGKELELRVKEGETELSRIKFDVENEELIVRSSNDESDENKLRIRLDGSNFIITRNGEDAFSRFPLVVDDATGTIFVQTPNGEIKLGVMPDTIVEKAEASDDVDEVSEVELEVGDDSSLEFQMVGIKSEKLFGVFTLQIPSTVIYDAQTGAFLRSDESFVTKILDLFSF